MSEQYLQELRFASQSIKQDIGKTEKSYSEEFSNLGNQIYFNFHKPYDL